MNSKTFTSAVLAATVAACVSCSAKDGGAGLVPVDYVNPSMGAISHLLMPAFPTVQLPNSMLRVYPCRTDATGDRLFGLPVTVTNHRETWAFALSPLTGGVEGLEAIPALSYDNEEVRPYYYSVYLDEEDVDVEFAPSHQSAVYEFTYNGDGERWLVLATKAGGLQADGGKVTGWQSLTDRTKVYVSMQVDAEPGEPFEEDDVAPRLAAGGLLAHLEAALGVDGVAVAGPLDPAAEKVRFKHRKVGVSTDDHGRIFLKRGPRRG